MKTEIEGEETLKPSGEGSLGADIYPDAEVNIYPERASVFQIKRKWEKDPPMLNLSPTFQREFVWPERKRCELVESIIMGIPLPAFYVKEDNEGVYVVVDGKQRLTTLFSFINGEFKLKGLKILRSLNGKKFSDLLPVQQNKIEDYTLQLNVIKPPTSDRVVFDLFDRVNRGGVNLNNQEMRNALYQGTATKLLDELAQYQEFKEATENAVSAKHMKDRYIILRFLAFYMWHKQISFDEKNNALQYRSDMEDFLGETMRFINRQAEDSALVVKLKEVFKKTMLLAKDTIVVLGGFRLPPKTGGNKRPLNMVFFESLSVLLANLKISSFEHVKSIYTSLLDDPRYVDSLTYSIDSNVKIRARYEIVNSYILRE